MPKGLRPLVSRWGMISAAIRFKLSQCRSDPYVIQEGMQDANLGKVSLGNTILRLPGRPIVGFFGKLRRDPRLCNDEHAAGKRE